MFQDLGCEVEHYCTSTIVRHGANNLGNSEKRHIFEFLAHLVCFLSKDFFDFLDKDSSQMIGLETRLVLCEHQIITNLVQVDRILVLLKSRLEVSVECVKLFTTLMEWNLSLGGLSADHFLKVYHEVVLIHAFKFAVLTLLLDLENVDIVHVAGSGALVVVLTHILLLAALFLFGLLS